MVMMHKKRHDHFLFISNQESRLPKADSHFTNHPYLCYRLFLNHLRLF